MHAKVGSSIESPCDRCQNVLFAPPSSSPSRIVLRNFSCSILRDNVSTSCCRCLLSGPAFSSSNLAYFQGKTKINRRNEREKSSYWRISRAPGIVLGSAAEAQKADHRY